MAKRILSMPLLIKVIKSESSPILYRQSNRLPPITDLRSNLQQDEDKKLRADSHVGRILRLFVSKATER